MAEAIVGPAILKVARALYFDEKTGKPNPLFDVLLRNVNTLLDRLGGISWAFLPVPTKTQDELDTIAPSLKTNAFAIRSDGTRAPMWFDQNASAWKAMAANVSDFAQTLLDDATQTEMRATLGIISPTLQVFTTAGANVWTKPAGLTSVIVRMRGGGGGGGGCSSASASKTAAGGGQGEFAERRIAASLLADTETATVGAGGAAGSTAGGAGGTGGTTSFGSLLTAIGGNGGLGVTAAGPSIPGGGGTGGANGDLAIRGANGQHGSSADNHSGGGGGEGGGDGRFTIGTGNGFPGVRGGGGGGGCQTGTNTATGGLGGDGWIEVIEFY